MSTTSLSQPQALASLRELGFNPHTTDDYRADVIVFQETWMLGAPLAVDGIVGPKTSDALDLSVGRARAAARGQRVGGSCSPHFSYSEFACPCLGACSGCRRIVVQRALVIALEVLREAYYPGGLSPEDVYRCPQHNAAIGAVGNSMHTFGAAADIPMVASRSKVAGLGRFTGVGYQHRTLLTRHVDVRGQASAQFPSGRIPTWTPTSGGKPVTVSNPAFWEYCS